MLLYICMQCIYSVTGIHSVKQTVVVFTTEIFLLSTILGVKLLPGVVWIICYISCEA